MEHQKVYACQKCILHATKPCANIKCLVETCDKAAVCLSYEHHEESEKVQTKQGVSLCSVIDFYTVSKNVHCPENESLCENVQKTKPYGCIDIVCKARLWLEGCRARRWHAAQSPRSAPLSPPWRLQISCSCNFFGRSYRARDCSTCSSCTPCDCHLCCEHRACLRVVPRCAAAESVVSCSVLQCVLHSACSNGDLSTVQMKFSHLSHWKVDLFCKFILEMSSCRILLM